MLDDVPDRPERRTLGGLLSGLLPDLRRWILARRGTAKLGAESTSDLVQSVCREALSARPGFEDQGDVQFRAWVRTLAERKLADRAKHWSAEKREASRRVELDPESHGGRAGEPTESVLDELGRRELTERLSLAIRGLPPDQRAVLELQVREDLSTAAIAARLGKTEGAVRTLRSRALAAVGCVLERAAD
ncbi:MAG: sigma-70 family RNA polymerase sigma factor [Planctomycetes bacterium]|nr:sigma-70 family RNA polymerase sigma factor [Planctomycetota bacterium]